jgi:putative FmdB family regulatory protein
MLYEYLCSNCKKEIEVEQKISDAPLEICPNCKDGKLSKLISRSSFVLAGSGWYRDGYSGKK